MTTSLSFLYTALLKNWQVNGLSIPLCVFILMSVFTAGFSYSQEINRGTLSLQADEVCYDGQVICLKGHVQVKQNDTFCLSTAHEMSIHQGVVNGKKTVVRIESPHTTSLSYLDIKSGQPYKMIAPKGILFDHEHQEILFWGSIEDPSKLTNEEQQVCLEGTLGEAHADKVSLKYKWENDSFVPEKLTLENHVSLKNRFNGHLQESGGILHCALADQVDYFPDKQEMVLSSKGENRVLFFDKVNHVQISAISLKLQRDPLTNKECIQGIGEVRFTFIEKELKELHKHFFLNPSSTK